MDTRKTAGANAQRRAEAEAGTETERDAGFTNTGFTNAKAVLTLMGAFVNMSLAMMMIASQKKRFNSKQAIVKHHQHQVGINR